MFTIWSLHPMGLREIYLGNTICSLEHHLFLVKIFRPIHWNIIEITNWEMDCFHKIFPLFRKLRNRNNGKHLGQDIPLTPLLGPWWFNSWPRDIFSGHNNRDMFRSVSEMCHEYNNHNIDRIKMYQNVRYPVSKICLNQQQLTHVQPAPKIQLPCQGSSAAPLCVWRSQGFSMSDLSMVQYSWITWFKLSCLSINHDYMIICHFCFIMVDLSFIWW